MCARKLCEWISALIQAKSKQAELNKITLNVCWIKVMKIKRTYEKQCTVISELMQNIINYIIKLIGWY